MSGEIIAILAVGVALAGLFLAWKTSQKNGELSVEMEKRTREHLAFANRFSVITDVEAEAQAAQEKLATKYGGRAVASSGRPGQPYPPSL